jgi:hypothetical protein
MGHKAEVGADAAGAVVTAVTGSDRGTVDASARRQPRYGEVFVDGVPVDAHAPADEPPGGTLLR